MPMWIRRPISRRRRVLKRVTAAAVKVSVNSSDGSDRARQPLNNPWRFSRAE